MSTDTHMTLQERGESTPNIEMKPERNYDDAMVEDLAKTHAQALVKLDHAEKLAEALREIRNALDAPHKHSMDKALLKVRPALAAYESEVR